MPTYFDVCSGIGMGSLAAQVAGFDVVGHCEIHPYCQAVLRKHWPEVPIFDDLRQLTSQSLRERGIDRVDLFAGWIPCQPASIAGQRKGASDDRWLWGEFVRLVQELRPLYLLAENPTGALSLTMPGDDDGESEQFMDWVCGALEAEGYEVQPYVFGAWAVGSPQRRDRVFIVGRNRNRMANTDGAGPSPERNMGATRPASPGNAGAPSQGSIKLGDTLSCGLQGQSRGRSGDVAQDANEPYEPMADTDHAGREEQWQSVTADARQPELGSGRQFESRLGGTAPRSTWRLDRPLWPAGRGAEQFGYEPPRLAKGTAYRQERLMALGNMVVPQCVLPLFEFIRAQIET